MPTSQANQPKTLELNATESAKTLGRVLSRAKTFESPAILLVEMPSENARRAAAEALQIYLQGADDELIDVDLRDQQDLFQRLGNLKSNQVASIHALHAQPEVVRRLNWRREFFAKNALRVVFWLNFEEINDLAQRAPDFWAFRNRQIMLAPLLDEAKQERSVTVYYSSALELSNLSNEAKRDRIAALEELLKSISDFNSERAQSLISDLARLNWTIGKHTKSIIYLQQVLEISRETNNRRNEGVWLGNLGNAFRDLGEIPKAIEHYQQALEISRETNNRRNEGVWLGNLGNAFRDLGEIPKAIEHYQQALNISREIGDVPSEGYHLGNLGTAYQSLDKIPKAIEHYQQALEISREIGDKRNMGIWLGHLANAFQDLGEIPKAIEHYQQALNISREIGDKRNRGILFGNMGAAYNGLGEIPKAIEQYQQALEISREIGDKQVEGTFLGNLGTLYYKSGEIKNAVAVWIASFSLYQASQYPYRTFVLGQLSKACILEPNFESILCGLFPSGDIILNKATGQNYTFYKDAPPELPDQILELLDRYEKDNPQS